MGGGMGALAAAEIFLTKKYASRSPAFAPVTTLALPRLYGMVLANTVAGAFVMFFLGLKVGMCRKDFQEKAKKEGDENAEERYGSPKMYAEGFDKLAKDHT